MYYNSNKRLLQYTNVNSTIKMCILVSLSLLFNINILLIRFIYYQINVLLKLISFNSKIILIYDS